MRLTGLRFALLVWIPGLLLAVDEGEPCGAPDLKNGYFLPVRESHPHGSHVTYSCDAGYKTTEEGWWATIICQDGVWYKKPECVVDTVCVLPVIPNGKFKQNLNGSLEINCNAGYSLNGQDNIVECHSGTWSAVPLCQKHPRACGEPPVVPNAVVTQTYQEVFAAYSKVEYQCRQGFLTEDRQSKKSAYCEGGNWAGIPRCTRAAEPTDTQTTFVSIDNCGEIPHVPNGLPEPQEQQRSLKYTCQNFYKLVGPDTVVCHRGGTWSEVPKCKEDFCLLDTTEYSDLINSGNTFIRNGGTEYPRCVDKWTLKNYAVVRCIDGNLSVSRCCNWAKIDFGLC
ncbi:complement factor H-related protein 1-like [Xiphophorus maculatus]|uniref:Complement factor H-related protein 1-like n=1 Tax=Xiphophorus maculatus TaxID=8083 RepID=A0A3B5RD45_XIPMA|nr:complement factor H-related protein 1-like [Xiphophorus maculatus]